MSSLMMVAEFTLLLLLITVPSNAAIFVNGTLFCNTYIYDFHQGSQPSLTLTCPLNLAPLYWTGKVTGIISTGVNYIHGVRITNSGMNLTFNAFIPALSGVYTCSDGEETNSSSILLTTSNPSLNIISQQPVKLYDGASQLKLNISSYFLQNNKLQLTPADDITIYYYSDVLEYIAVPFSANFTSQCQYELILHFDNASLPSGTTVFMNVDNGNGTSIEASFNVTTIALYLTALPTQIFALVGDNVTIDCSPSDPVIAVKYYYHNQSQQSYNIANGGKYHILSVTEENSGTYECTGYAPHRATLTRDFNSTESVTLTVLSDAVTIYYKEQVVANVSIINTNASHGTLTCVSTYGNSRLQWMTSDNTINNYLEAAYLNLHGRNGAAIVNNSQLEIINSANTTTLIINDVHKYSTSFLSCVSRESGLKAMTLMTQVNPFVIVHPDLPPDAAVGQSFEMMFVVGHNSDGTSNNIDPYMSGNVTAHYTYTCTLGLNSNVLSRAIYFSELPFTLRYPIPIHTNSEGYYTLYVDITIQLQLYNFSVVFHVTVNTAAYLKVIVPNISVMPSPVNVLQGSLTTLSCVPSDMRAPIIWEVFNESSTLYTKTINSSEYSHRYNGHSISFHTLLIPASLQELGLLSLPDPSLGVIEPPPILRPFVTYVHTKGILMFRCSLINGSRDEMISHDIQLNVLRGSVQMAVTFSNGSHSTLFNDTTINNAPEHNAGTTLITLECLALNGLGTPVLRSTNAMIDEILQHGGIYQNSISVSSTNVSISVQVNHSLSSYMYVKGYFRCSISNGYVSVLNVTNNYQYIAGEESPVISLPLGSVGLLHFQIAFDCYDGLRNPALIEPSFVQVTMHTYEGIAFHTVLLSHYSSGILFAPFVTGPTSLALYINPVKQINAGVYSVMAAGLFAAVTLNITIPTLSVMQSKVSVLQWNSTQISCIPSQADVQIQWTFFNSSTVLATGFQYTYTINATSIEYEGVYVCSVLGIDANIVEPQTVYVNVIAVCPITYAAGVIWKAAYENQTVLMPCNNADPKFSKVTQMSRRCLPSGEWDVVDFTTCTLQSQVETPFVLVWSSLLDVGVTQEEEFLMDLTDMNITYSIINISSSTGLFAESGSPLIAIMMSANLGDEQFTTVISVATSRYGKRQVGLSISLSYAVMWPSDPCKCKSYPGNVFYLCSGVQSSPCNCTNSTQCQCIPPFVGDGQLCTIDSDLDGVPDNPLNCSDSLYCMKDNCPYIFNPPMDGIQSDLCNSTLKDGCKPVFDPVWELQWPNAPLNFTYRQPCPHGGVVYVSGSVYRFCSGTGDWGPTNVTECESYLFRHLAQQVLLPSLDTAYSIEILNNLFIETQPDNISTLPLDLRDSVFIIATVSDLFVNNLHQNGDIQDTFIFLDVVNNLLNETNLVGWQILQEVDPDTSSPHLLQSTESYGIYVASSIIATKTIILSRSSIVLQASKLDARSHQGDITFPDSKGSLFENASFLADEASLVIPDTILLERAVNSTSSIPVANMIIKNINMFLPSSNESIFGEPVSLLLSSQVAVEDGGFASVALTTRPVIINFKVNNVTAQYQCSFWDFKKSYWSSEGMLLPTISGSVVQCYSTHLTSFAVLLAVKTFPESKALTVISYVGCGISMVGLLATIFFFLSFRKQLIERPHNFVHLNLAIALFLAFLVFVAGVEHAKHNETACMAVAALLQYFWLSAFCWMMCEGVMLYLMLVVVFSSLKKKWWFFLLLGWLTPLMFVLIGLAARSNYYVVRNKDDNTISYCWISTDKGTIWAFAIPVIIIMLINIIFLIMVLVVIARKGRQNQTHAKNFKDNARIVISFLKATILLLPILGGTWIFGLLSINEYTLVFTWLFTILNSLQGLFIFIFYVLRDEKVWGRIKKKYENRTSSNSSDTKKIKTSRPQIKTNASTDLKLSEISAEGKFNNDTKLWF